MKWSFILSCGGRIGCHTKENFGVFQKNFYCNSQRNLYNTLSGINQVQSADCATIWFGNPLVNRAVWTTSSIRTPKRGNFFTLFKVLCTTSEPGSVNKNTTHSTGKISYTNFAGEDSLLSAKGTERVQDGAAKKENSSPNSSSIVSGSNSKKKRRERIPHTRERRDMFWRGVITLNKVEAHAGVTTFAMVVRSLEAKPIFSPPCSPARQGYLLADDYNLHIIASTASFGKKAVPRVKARRRLREACRRIFPFHARRHKEYTITAHPVVLFAKWEDILADVYEALKRTNCYIEEIDS
ncbi:hypothetical protein GpartN1_g5556.t1 [Galdieria partita]|uniref:Uncharacterized protein n=1 Tax=Galdieria partita TaxID=83374 RepID=A0A9C7UST2_9RHOD|nr:hypothetical protein GpartN1_g5556.t1 [Galdieria partita]